MENFIVGQEPVAGKETRRGLGFWGAVIVTVLIGAAVGAGVIFRFRPPPAPPPVFLQAPPEIRLVEKPAPPPKVIIQEVPQPAPAPRLEPPLPQQLIAGKPTWDGVWRQKSSPLPAFRLRQAAAAIAGICAPNWGSDIPFQGGRADGDTVEFAVDDGIIRVRFRMTREAENVARVESWITDEDWLVSKARANQAAVRNPRLAPIYRAILERNVKLRKRTTVGTFLRQSNQEGE